MPLASRKQIREYPVTCEVRGKACTGRSVVEGTRHLYQTIWYGPYSKPDGRRYHPGQDANMATAARIILRELVEENGSM